MSHVPPDLPSWADVKVYTGGRYTWNKPPNAQMVYINAYSKGGNGGTGFNRTTGTGGGGGGGNGGPALYTCIPASCLPDTLNINIPRNAASDVSSFTITTPNALNLLYLADTQLLNGPGGSAGTVSAGGGVTTTNGAADNSAVAPYGLYQALGSIASQVGPGRAGSLSAGIDFSAGISSIDGSGGGGAGIDTNLFPSRGATIFPDNGPYWGGNNAQYALHQTTLRGGRAPQIQLLGSDAANARSISATFTGGETVIVAIGSVLSDSTSTWFHSVVDGTNTYIQISDFAPNTGSGQGGMILFKADNVVAGTYTITANQNKNGSFNSDNCKIAYYRYSGLASGPELARAVNSQNGPGTQFESLTCGPLSSASISTTTPALLFCATYGQSHTSEFQKLQPGGTINRLIEGRSKTTNSIVGPHAGDSLVLTSDPITAKFSVIDFYTYRCSAAVLLALSGPALEVDAQPGADGTWNWIPGTIVPLLRGGAGGGSSHFGAGGRGGNGAPGCGGGGGGSGNPGGAGGVGGDGLVIIASW